MTRNGHAGKPGGGPPPQVQLDLPPEGRAFAYGSVTVLSSSLAQRRTRRWCGQTLAALVIRCHQRSRIGRPRGPSLRSGRRKVAIRECPALRGKD
jgi:hypothetical protein